MKLEDIKDGEIYWTIAPDMESEGYGDDTPRYPYRGKAKLIYDRNDKLISFRLHSFDKEGNIDEDSNATAFPRENQVFLTKEEAQAYYAKAVLEKVREMLLVAVSLLGSI